MLKRIFLFLLTNIAVIAAISIIIAIAENIFWINISGYGSGYMSIFIFSLIVWFAWSFISLLMSKWMAKKAYGVEVLSKNEVSDLSQKHQLVFRTVEDLSERFHINTPEVGFYTSSEPNAFATGASKNKSLVAVSTGLLNAMNEDEIEWVIAHEMAHVLNGDMVTMTLLQWVLNTFVIFFARIIANIADNFLAGEEEQTWPSWVYYIVSIVLELIFGVFASLIAMKFSRYREFRADYGSAEYVGKRKMISALKALQKMQNAHLDDDSKFASMKISTKTKKWGFMNLFSSHPDLQDRINALENASI